MSFCPYCGYSNPTAASVCGRCGRPLTISQPAAPSATPAPAEPAIRPALWYGMIGLAALVVMAVAYGLERGRIDQQQVRLTSVLAELDRTHAAEVAAADAAGQQQAAAEEAAQQERLGDRYLLSGDAARESHTREWQRRLAHDPTLAASVLEANLLRMERIGHDPAVAAKAALEEVARLASPPGSRVEVTPGAGGFVIRVAFKMSAVTKNEKGAVTKHNTVASMQREIEELSARLIKEQFDYCGSRGIARLSVSCNHAVQRSHVPDAATEAERKHLLGRAGVVMSCLYRVSVDGSQAATVANWRAVSVPQVIRMLRVEKDGLKTLTIQGQAALDRQEDPNMPLEF